MKKNFALLFTLALLACSNNSDGIATAETQDKNNINSNNTTAEKEVETMNVYCGNNKLEIELSGNASSKAFAEKLKTGDVTVSMSDYGNFEKVGSLGFSIVRSDEEITTGPGDVILYQGNQVTIYYDENSWDFTRLGKIKGMIREKMLDFFGGKGTKSVRFSLN